MPDDLSIALLNRYRDGDEHAASELFERYVHRLMGLARQRLSNRLARRIDPDDVIQSVYRSFFRAAAEGSYELQRSGDLWRLLVAITLNKLRMQARRHNADKRSMKSEESIAMSPGSFGIAPERIAENPQPEEVAAVSELLKHVMEGMTIQQREMLELRLQNYKIEEIAAEVGCSERTVRRLLDQVKQRFQTDLEQSMRDP